MLTTFVNLFSDLLFFILNKITSNSTGSFIQKVCTMQCSQEVVYTCNFVTFSTFSITLLFFDYKIISINNIIFTNKSRMFSQRVIKMKGI